MEPGPIPTLIPSAPALTRNFAAAAVAMFPTITSIFEYCFLICFKTFITPLECPCAVSITIASTPASTNALHLSIESSETPIAAATFNLPKSSLLDFGF